MLLLEFINDLIFYKQNVYYLANFTDGFTFIYIFNFINQHKAILIFYSGKMVILIRII